MSGTWVFVCGPSGAGKDSVIASARQALGVRNDIVFARRMITRAVQAGSDHEAVGEAEFGFLRKCNALAWHWEAHGFGYGVPARYAHQVAWGRVVVVNGSREHADSLPANARIRRVLVTAPLSQLVERLHSRGREEPEAVEQRLARNALLTGHTADLVIENGGTLEAAGTALRHYLEALALAARLERHAVFA
jgi:phosphonate metabolism protein PhnN/1,5-bisphosphokinase (PRPP-forming)